MPGEWEPQSRVWLGWPQWLEDPKEGQQDQAQIAFAAVAKAIAQFEPVTVAANPDQVSPHGPDPRTAVWLQHVFQSEPMPF